MSEAPFPNTSVYGLASEHSRRAYERALSDFFHWHRGMGHPQLNKAVVQRYAAEVREAGMAASSINQRLSAISKLALGGSTVTSRVTTIN